MIGKNITKTLCLIQRNNLLKIPKKKYFYYFLSFEAYQRNFLQGSEWNLLMILEVPIKDIEIRRFRIEPIKDIGIWRFFCFGLWRRRVLRLLDFEDDGFLFCKICAEFNNKNLRRTLLFIKSAQFFIVFFL
ncbi:hypothetical protein GLOIN_2v1473359 [Rhizophagus irregularis DAOM 181602=DAOM 197198]|uniref:Uncharacterized protein n=1 Tax=Rhizophagus irregularis (strain DAOM 181602 / DAOM 197198 / MUCL 43194) TaxID=747089 RepID=A0A2P4QKX5_RHIID|nr:hypothetical protein GLOIN_2v1473359 [Rhizophagus irregularis DAOM 181602=DAOM 197198]POG78284.1 hypothetical protein GLOIN_2v1473359 [Rhizophagus irregularis DAOM 181602=DAOM 197198]|eukprot:XP_025185150.1 hypothetical protein GLOIN_2v1473359 [Rhizophagus irregularis DAOM 181602=DAOM 197198]